MIRVKLMLACALTAFSVAAPAAYSVEKPVFSGSPVSSIVLAGVHGTGTGFAADFPALTNERARTDERTFASIGAISIDAWWADVGAELIAANLVR